MSVKLNLHQTTRPYKIDIFGLQDNFIGTLQAYEDSFLGQIVEPRMNIKDDGTQTFTCKIPKFYLSETPNKRVINPRWQDAENGVLAENTRVLKVTVQFSETDIKTFPFIIDKITNKRDNNFSVYKEINGNGLAFAELGTVGYKVELNSHTLEEDFAEDSTTIASIDYWLDKIFPNEKDEDGVITRWLTPWSYEIRMDWRGYFEQFSDTFIDGGIAGQTEGYNFYNSRTAEWTEDKMKNWLLINAGTSGPLYQGRDETKIYENPYVANWEVSNNKFRPIAVENFIEKARYIDCANSNKYNITQTLAETFEVFCVYEYTCDANGYFKKTYWDEYGNVWTGKKVVFFNRAIKTDSPFVINYQHNLQSISRTADTTELYTKMYVNPVASEILDTGYVSIADTTLNPLLDDFILNFDYLYEIGSINDLQKAEIENYKIQLHKLNKELISLEELYNDITVELNDAEAALASAETSLASVQEQLVNYEALRDNEVTNTPVIRNQSNAYSLVMVPQTGYDIVQGTFRLNGINAATLKGWRNSKYGKNDDGVGALFDASSLISVQAPFSPVSNQINNWYLTFDEYGFPATLFTSKQNPIFKPTSQGGLFGEKFSIDTGAIIYLELEYCPKNKYEVICNKFYAQIAKEQSKINLFKEQIGSDESEDYEEWTGLKRKKKDNELARTDLLNKKEALNFRLERMLGPALREGYWQPDTYEDPGQGHNDSVSWKEEDKRSQNGTYFIFDEELFEDEQEAFYYDDPLNISEEGKKYYSYIDLSKIYSKIGTPTSLPNFCLTLVHPTYEWEIQPSTQLVSNGTYYFLLDSKYYSFKTGTQSYGTTTNPVQTDTLVLHTKSTKDHTAPFITVKRSTQADGSNAKVIDTFDTKLISAPLENSNGNLTTAFMGLGQYLNSRHLYNNAGFVFSILKRKDDYIPVALLQSEEIDYSRYGTVQYSLDGNNSFNTDVELTIEENSSHYPVVYPRLFLDYRNVNTNSENFQLFVTSNSKKLVNYEDYSILLRKGKAYVTLKVTEKNIPWYIFNEQYNIIYQVSRANEMLYLDAKQVAKDNSKPKYSYSITIANIPEEVGSLELGQLAHINDYSIDVYKEYGYVSELNYQLDAPSKDSVTIANYKTKFEDLFSSISAQNEAMKQNQTAYNIAASSFTSSGQVEQVVFQNTLDSNNFAFNFSNTNITLDDTGGLVLTNTNQYTNGVYGQVALRGGGIFCSNSVDANGNRIWSTGVTPDGVNASLVSTGQLDTNLIRIYAGDTLAFQWNSEGLFAYRESVNENSKPELDEKNYIKLNEDGLLYVNDGSPKLELGWNGLTIQDEDGHIQLTSTSGLQMFDANNKPIATFGKYNDVYGMFISNAEGVVVLQATSSGLNLTNTILVGDNGNNFVGLCGQDDYLDSSLNSYVRFWAGAETPTNASLIITEKGEMRAKTIVVPSGGKIIFKGSGNDIELTYEALSSLV